MGLLLAVVASPVTRTAFGEKGPVPVRAVKVWAVLLQLPSTTLEAGTIVPNGPVGALAVAIVCVAVSTAVGTDVDICVVVL